MGYFGKIAAVMLSAAVLASCTVNKPAEPERTITVSGTGSVSVKPDQTSLMFSVRTTEWNVNTATERNASITEKVLAAVKEEGIDASDLATYDYRITQDTYRENGRDWPGRYTVANSVSVLIRNPEITGKVIDVAVKNGANCLTLSSFDYSLSDTTSVMRQARTLAVQNAQDAAALIAGASGCKIGTVMDIRENGTSSAADARVYKSAAYSNSPVTPIEAGTVSVSSYVTVTYSLQ